MSSSSKSYIPQDVVSIFHCSFHPTKGNVLDWSWKVDQDLDLSNVEFSTLPSGLHLVEQDVVYFTKGEHQGVSVFCRKRTSEQGHRGFRLSSFGILLAKSARPRPWRHVQDLKALSHSFYATLEERGLEPVDSDWKPAIAFFEQRKAKATNLIGGGDWKGWSDELDGPTPDLFSLTTHLPHLLRILGLSTLTLYKHVLGRRRILIYTLPPVEASCILCQVAADLCYEDQVDYDLISGDNPSFGMDDGGSRTDGSSLRPKGRSRESVRVLGMVTLNDLDRLKSAGNCGRGWIACTTDALFLEKPSHYDLIIDLTSCTPFKASRPTLYISRPIDVQPNSRSPTHRLSPVRFTWSDFKLWTELDRLLRKDSEDVNCCEPSFKSSPLQPTTAWHDIWSLYEDVCIVCAGLWMGNWRNNSVTSYSTVDGNMSNWGQIRLDGDDDLSVGGPYVRNLGMGIEGRPPHEQSNQVSTTSLATKTSKRGNGTSSWSTKATGKCPGESQTGYDVEQVNEELEEQDKPGTRERQVLTTLALLQTFHAHTANILTQLSCYLPSSPPESPLSASQNGTLGTITLTPKDLLSFELGPLSGLDARFIEWLGDEYGPQAGVRVVVKRGWRDLVCFVFGFG